jgi:hypothetical protein
MNNMTTTTKTPVIPFGSALPAYLTQATGSDLGNYTQGVGGGFPVMSIKGKTFTLVQDGTRAIVTRPDDPDSPASYIEVVFLRSNPALSKTYYPNGYEEGSAERPHCASSDGIRPDAGVPSPQAKNCASCPQNVFGTSGTGKGKACQDTRRIAIASLAQLDNPMLLRVPPASLKSLAKYALFLGQHNVKTMAAVVTRIKFDAAEATPKLLFEARAFLEEGTYHLVSELAQSELVQQIIGLMPVPEDDAEPAPTLNIPKVSHEQVAAAIQPKPAAKKAPAPVVEEEEAEEEEAPAPKKAAPKATPKPAAKKAPAADADIESLNAALDDLLGEYDG